MTEIFSKIPVATLKRSKQRIGNQNTLTMDFGQLIPGYCKLLYPGDTIRGNTIPYVEFMPMWHPIRADVDVYVHHFVVPLRLIWSDFELFITGGRLGDDNPDMPASGIGGITPDGTPILPQFNLSQMMLGNRAVAGSLYDYLNYPTKNSSSDFPGDVKPYYVSGLKFRAYCQIFNDYYIDRNLSEPINFTKLSGVMTSAQMRTIDQILYRAWRKDYFTSALPFAQRGGAVQIQSPDMLIELKSTLSNPLFVTETGLPVREEDIKTNQDGAIVDSEGNPVFFDPNGTLSMSGGSIFTVEDLRNYLAVQRQLERDAVGGSRYIENILANFGVKGKDARLQRAEYVAGSKTPVMVSSVRQTSETTEGNELGQDAGIAVASGGNNFFTYFATEHCYFMTIVSVIPKASYYQGVEREDLFKDRFDFYWPTFQHLGEQSIKNSELYFDPTDTAENNDATFGYAPRYAEMKFKLNEIHGQMRSSLLDWHLARSFANRPNLNENFIRVTPDDASRIFSVTDTSSVSNHLIVTLYNDFYALRPCLNNPQPKII